MCAHERRGAQCSGWTPGVVTTFSDKGKCLCGHLLDIDGQQIARAENVFLSFSKERMGERLWWSPSLLDGFEWGIGITLQRKGGTWNRHELGLPISLLAPKKNLLGVWVCGCKGVHVHAHTLSSGLPGWHEFLRSQVESGRGRLGHGRAGMTRKQAI